MLATSCGDTDLLRTSSHRDVNRLVASPDSVASWLKTIWESMNTRSITYMLKSSKPGHGVRISSAKAQGISEEAFPNPKQQHPPVVVVRPRESWLISHAQPARLLRGIPSKSVWYDPRQQKCHVDASSRESLLHERTSPMCPDARGLSVIV